MPFRTNNRFPARRRVLAGAAVCALVTMPAGGQEFEGDTIVFGGDAAYPPFEWDDDGEPRGFNVDLAGAIARAGGVNARFHLGEWPEVLRALESGEVDAVPMFVSERREQQFAFTPPFHFVSHGIYARSEHANVATIDALDGRTVAVEASSYAHEQQAGRSGFEPSLVLTANTVEALDAVAEGRAEFALLAAPTTNFLIAERDLPLRNVGPPLWSRGYAFAVRGDRPALAQWLTEQFYAVLRSNAYHETFDRWESTLAPAENDGFSRMLPFLLISLAVLTVVGLAWAFRLRRTVMSHAKRLLEEKRRRRDAESDAAWRANHDVETSLPRLHHFIRQVEALLVDGGASGAAEKQIVALKPADFDRMIRTLGHEAGTSTVRDFVERLRAMRFEAYGQAGRDVFFVFGDRARIDGKLRAVLSPDETGAPEAAPLPRLFAGAAVWPRHGRKVTELIRHAETALAVATERREGWCEYERAMDPDEAALMLVEAFRETSSTGLYAVFQPQFDLREGAIVGAEALVRWNAPGLGNVAPDRFIPLLEDAGLVRHVTKFMLHEAVRVGAELRRAGRLCPISVNVAVADLLTDRMRNGLLQALEVQSCVPGDIKIELTETSVAEQPEAIGATIARLRESGIVTSIDDFGTGYSSLSYLSDFPISEVKIDRSFVAGMGTKKQDRSIVRSMIAMAHELGLLVVAEGVETAEEVEMLRLDSCDRAQGHFYSRPMSEAEFLDYARRYAPGRFEPSSCVTP